MRSLSRFRFHTALLAVALAAPAATPLAAQSEGGPRVSVHGFLSQGAGAATGGQVVGVPTHGTVDYRNAALQVRYDASEKDNLIIQFSHERLGESPLVAGRHDVQLDWVFYERKFGAGLSGRVGRVKIPTGIYNEIRDVGTLIPLYRPPFAVYSEEVFSTESIDGAVLSRNSTGAAWTADVHAYAGGWSFRNHDLARSRTRNALGSQVWLNTGLPGLRLGLGGRLADIDRHADDPAASYVQDAWQYQGSLDWTQTRFFLRGEYAEFEIDSRGQGTNGSISNFQTMYAQAGVTPVGALTLVAQAEKANIRYDITRPVTMRFDKEAHRDLAVGARYAFRPDLVAKAEWHWYTGYQLEDRRVDYFTMPAGSARYGLVSLAVSF